MANLVNPEKPILNADMRGLHTDSRGFYRRDNSRPSAYLSAEICVEDTSSVRTNSGSKTISLVIPAYCEERNLGYILKEINSLKIKNIIEIIVIDDSSKDKTKKIAEEFGAKVISHSQRLGKGFALRTGFLNVRGDFVLTMDSDGQDCPQDIPLFLKYLNGYDLIIGSRFKGKFSQGAIKKINFWATKGINFFINFLFKTKITDSQSGFRCIKKDKISEMNLYSNEFEIETEILLKALKERLNIIEIPVTRLKRKYGRSNFRRLRNGAKILLVILKEFFTR